jgi:hypothetical protein
MLDGYCVDQEDTVALRQWLVATVEAKAPMAPVTRFHRFVAGVVLGAFFFTATGVAQAQSPMQTQPVSTSGDTAAAGLMDGEMLAESLPTGGKFGTGLGIGVLTGLIGTGIGYFVIGPESPSAELLVRGEGRSADYQLGLKTGWEKKTKSKKRNAFLAGGLLGTAAWVTLLVAAQSGGN